MMVSLASGPYRKLSQLIEVVTVVSPNSYFSFTPFLASTTVGTLEYRCATEPVRGIKGINFAQAWAEEIGEPADELRRHSCAHLTDFANKRLTVESAVPAPTGTNVPDRKGGVHVHVDGDKEFYGIEYDKLVIAVGCYSASLGIEGVSTILYRSVLSGLAGDTS